MRSRFEALVRQFGQDVTLEGRDGQLRQTRAFVQPALRQRETIPASLTPLGAVSRDRWLYLGPAGEALSPGDRVSLDGLALTVQECRQVPWKNEVLYLWAVLHPRKEAAL